ncbi:hypothetical protein BGZ79_008412 [Entomortierella chlamydospora]|nr:hypothetical protein BGZ79_008412 [Entomortierella chlamydospora]
MTIRHRSRPRTVAHEHDHGVDPEYYNTILGHDSPELPPSSQFIQSQADLDTHLSHSQPIFEDEDFAESTLPIQPVRRPSYGWFKTLLKILFMALFIPSFRMIAQAFANLYSLWISQSPQKIIPILQSKLVEDDEKAGERARVSGKYYYDGPADQQQQQQQQRVAE